MWGFDKAPHVLKVEVAYIERCCTAKYCHCREYNSHTTYDITCSDCDYKRSVTTTGAGATYPENPLVVEQLEHRFSVLFQARVDG